MIFTLCFCGKNINKTNIRDSTGGEQHIAAFPKGGIKCQLLK